MIENILKRLDMSGDDLISQSVFKTPDAFKSLVNFYQRIEGQLSDTTLLNKKTRENYAYDHLVTHSENVAVYSIQTARLTQLDIKQIYEITLACILHDIEKIYWPVDILTKKTKDKFSESDWKRLIEHPLASAVLIAALTRNQVSQDVLVIIEQHHEDYNGEGYPNHLSGENIHIGARIIRIADSYDSMTSTRSYKTQIRTPAEALKEIITEAGIIYDPKLVKLFEKTIISL